MKVSITDYEDYLYDHYKSHGIDTSLFMKLVEEGMFRLITSPVSPLLSPPQGALSAVAVAQHSAPGNLGSMSAATPRPMSSPGAAVQSISPVAASYIAIPGVPNWTVFSSFSCTPKTSSPGREGTRSPA